MKTEILNIRVSGETKKEIQADAKRLGLSVSSYILLTLNAQHERNKNKDKRQLLIDFNK